LDQLAARLDASVSMSMPPQMSHVNSDVIAWHLGDEWVLKLLSSAATRPRTIGSFARLFGENWLEEGSMQYCGMGSESQPHRPAPAGESRWFPLETVRSVTVPLRVTTDAPPWTSTQISVSGPVFRDHTL